MSQFDVVVIGLGHAGVEAALAAVRRGARVGAISLDLNKAGVMSCNPAIGGTAKGHLVRELDALGGVMGFVADRCGTHFVTLNQSKGPSVRASRVLCDRDAYSQEVVALLKSTPGLELIEGEASEIHEQGGAIVGVTVRGEYIEAKSVVVTTGTFLQALMHRGEVKEVGGRLGDGVATSLSQSLRSLGLRLGRFKTGTPARLFHRSIDFEKCEVQPGDASPKPLSRRTPRAGFPSQPQIDCHITYTNTRTHDVLRSNVSRSPLFRGDIVGTGPRYCPSVEDKVVRFASRDRHTVFLEREGPQSELVYPAGLSTSMPKEVQLEFLRSIQGLENVEVARWGYAVEYDYVEPTQLDVALAVRTLKGLYLAGQLNGTSGYEEAAVQGLVAGANAAAFALGLGPLVLERKVAHAGVLIDELTKNGVDEPFRMMTSRSENRLELREGNAHFRLGELAYRCGLIGLSEWDAVRREQELIAHADSVLSQSGARQKLKQPTTRLVDVSPDVADLIGAELGEELEVRIKYEGYIKMSERLRLKLSGVDEQAIPENFDYGRVQGLSNEVRSKLMQVRPSSVQAASRISGVTPAALDLIAIYLKRGAAHVSRETT